MQIDVVAIESTLSKLNPHFLSVTDDGDFINVVVSHPRFVFQQMHERVADVFSLIKKYNVDIMKRKLVVVQPFSADEMQDLFEYWI